MFVLESKSVYVELLDSLFAVVIAIGNRILVCGLGEVEVILNTFLIVDAFIIGLVTCKL
jgi:hypothetical protein